MSQREIKFRAWVKEVYEDGEFAYGGYMVQPSEVARLVLRSTTNLMLGGTGTGIDYFEQGKLLPGLGSVERLRSDEIELMQYTGLHDKNGVEIYEGDIVEREFDYPNIGKFTAHGVVTWGHWYAGFMVPFKWNGHNKVERFKDQWVDANPRLEVIGNIYENADLLETAGESK